MKILDVVSPVRVCRLEGSNDDECTSGARQPKLDAHEVTRWNPPTQTRQELEPLDGNDGDRTLPIADTLTA